MFGEAVGITDVYVPGHPPNDFKYPGGFIQNVTYPDNEKACYVAGRLRILCNLGSVVFMTLPNDHTAGVSPNRPTPETMCAVNDEATGMVIEAVSKSPFWRSSLIFVTEDDTAQGGDHVDGHRTFLLAASPWVKRGYVSKTHIDISSMHKIIAHVLGLPYPNVIVENAALPLDMFTSTPDYTPFDHLPRSWPLACGGAANEMEARMTQSWDISFVDQSPGLDAQVGRWMRGRQIPGAREEEEEESERSVRRGGRTGVR